MLDSSSFIVSVEVMVAVKLETSTIAVNIQISATNLPQKVSGVLSPYPTVVNVTADHQNPEPNPFFQGPPNCSGFLLRSSIQTIAPIQIVRPNRRMISFKNSN